MNVVTLAIIEYMVFPDISKGGSLTLIHTGVNLIVTTDK
ncbi:MAG: hypothetical protein HJJLKODD_02933 [Phycisphaerae bacterium]|nr:hypothetical protein [Phycisphaerae bacterium]